MLGTPFAGSVALKPHVSSQIPAWRYSETWPFFRPNFSNLESYRQQYGAAEVVGFVPTGWLFEMKKTPYSGPSLLVFLIFASFEVLCGSDPLPCSCSRCCGVAQSAARTTAAFTCVLTLNTAPTRSCRTTCAS